MSVLRNAPYSLAQGAVVKAIIRAQNENGWSPYSDANTSGALVEYVPKKMATPTSGLATLESQIEVDWVALAGLDTGGATITSYNLQYDSGTNGITWIDVVGLTPAFTETSTILSSQITPGVTYKFKVRAANIHGFGDFSDVIAIKAAQKPSQMAAPVTSVDQLTGKLLVQWIAPHDGN